MVTGMIEEKPLFIEKQLTRWERPGSPKPGTAFVFIGNGRPALTVYEGQQGITHGEFIFGKYTSYYEIDMGERLLFFQEDLPSCDVLEFHAEVKLTYAVADPAVIVRCARTDAGNFLQDLAIDVMRRASRRYTYEQTGEAENILAKKIEDEVNDKGFKLTRPAFVKLALDETVHNLLAERRINEHKFLVEKEKNEMANNIAMLNQTARLDLKKARAAEVAPLIRNRDWQSLLAMFDPNDPADEYLRQILTVLSDQRRNQEAIDNKVIEIALEKGVIEPHELSALAKALIQDKTGLSDKAISYISEKTGVVCEEEEIEVPEEFSEKKPI
ncbi:MAG: hypothetical protein CDV28_1173 [Candidatus Electronema aureum]|uniref:Band 7 domain-containing protein n=1 Tax=Candidatus Electronema aureum TaxID=2005002 RepID=A0A521G162_9BACT|nr:MAG: hypothetical protein CDV28_1173 [Candidatus Electronema aureum]